MTIDLVTKFLPKVDEVFTTESKRSILTNQEFDWSGARTVKVYKISTADMNDYDRPGTGTNWSRYGGIQGLDAKTQHFTLRKDRSFTYALDKLDEDETLFQLAAASTLARQLREVVVPEVDTHVYNEMCQNAGHTPAPASLTASNIYDAIITANNALDNAQVPETSRYLVVTPDTYVLMKKSKDITMETDIGNDMRLKGVISNLDGAMIIKVPANRLPADFGFMLVHPCATVAPVKLEDFRFHSDPPGISGHLVEGRICYDAFVLDNKATAIYYQAKA